MIFRAAGDIVRLDVGGPVIGLIEGCAYDQGTVTLEPGDVFVAYTDGVSEAMNGDHEEWGEDQLAATTLPARSVACQELIARIMRAADDFVAGAPQHDDMTLVVVRRAEPASSQLDVSPREEHAADQEIRGAVADIGEEPLAGGGVVDNGALQHARDGRSAGLAGAGGSAQAMPW